MLIHVLGDLEVVVDGQQVDLGGAKPRTLVGLLVAADGRAVAIEQLIEEMWDGNPPARVEASLQSYVARLRRALDPGRTERGASERLRTHPGGYSLRQDNVELDARVFAAEVTAARAEPDPRAAVDALTAALARWRGEAYAGLASAGLRAEAVRLGELRMAATEDLWQRRTDLGDHAEAVGALERLVADHPLRERLWALLARALYLAARQGDALATLRRARDHLAEELGVDPGPELQALEQAILRQDPALAPTLPVPVPEDPEAGDLPGLFGREAALGAAEELLAAVETTGRGRVLVVEGESGIGKSRYAEEVVGRARRRGFGAGRGIWESDPCPPLWGWSRALSQVDAAAALQVDDAHDAASVSFQQADQVATALRAAGRSVLVLDDVQWADAESLRLLRRLAAGLVDVPTLLVLLVRREAVSSAALTETVAALTRLGADRLELRGLDPGAVRTWVRQRTGTEVDPEVAAALVARTEGNPFYLGEVVRLLASGGGLSDPVGDDRAVPAGVRDVVRQRLGSLDPGAHEVVTVAAVAGRTFDLGVVAEAVGRPVAEVADAAEALQVLGLVEEEGPGRFRFAHAIARDAVYEVLGGAARARAHAAVGAALEVRHASALVGHAAELARHYELAGPGYERSAWWFAQRASSQACQEASYDEALRLARLAGDLQDRDPALSAPEREELLLVTVRALLRLGRPIDAWEPASRAARSALERGDAAAAAAALVALTEDTVWGWRAHPSWDDDGIALWQQVIAAEPDVDPTTRALLRGGLSFELFFRPGDEELATSASEEAVRLARSAEVSEAQRMRVIKVAVVALLRPEMRARRLPLYDEVIGIATRVGDDATLAAFLTHRGSDRASLGQLDGWRTDVARAREIAVRAHVSEAVVISGWHEALRRELAEDWAGALAVVEEVEEFEATLAMPGLGIGLAHRAMVLEHQGRLAELEPVLAAAREHHPVFRELHALALVRAGRTDEVRSVLGDWADQPTPPRDYLTVTVDALRSRTWIALDDQDAVRALRDALTPFADELAIASGVLFTGSVHQALGELAAAAGDRAAARDHLTAALATHESLGLALWADQSRAALAALG
ncbi:hypothetical protein GCM10009623_37250 [Nocardioides aestuarii]|uniref:BTAD domain-containing putative transcriptional regulator n=1 Tax=Nocardioides aestuarii TaxID=252231 RepID=A0ABW4TT18_9ACTN